MLKTRVAVLVSGGGTNLEQLLLAQEEGRIPHGEIVLVLSNKPGVYALERAANHGVPSRVVESSGVSQAEFEAELQAALEEARAEMIVLAGFLRILSPEFIEKWPERIINVHPSLIPSFCGQGFYGLKVHEAALAYGVKLSGATVHLVNQIPDGGRILRQKAVEVLPDDTPEILQRRIMEQAEWILLPLATEDLCRSIAEEKQQSEA
ncbi:MAG: phosphoribosylglycinamide formyltransferase [Firmicutes bacterium]|nr:phosphoribosylglycinamide formyltransferase [Bacillota bacterium]